MTRKTKTRGEKKQTRSLFMDSTLEKLGSGSLFWLENSFPRKRRFSPHTRTHTHTHTWDEHWEPCDDSILGGGLCPPTTFEGFPKKTSPPTKQPRESGAGTLRSNKTKISCSVTPGKKGNPFWGRPFLVGEPPQKKGEKRVPLNN